MPFGDRERAGINNERANEITQALMRECHRVADMLGAKGVVMIALFHEGNSEEVAILDAGSSPVPLEDLYRMMLSAIEKLPPEVRAARNMSSDETVN